MGNKSKRHRRSRSRSRERNKSFLLERFSRIENLVMSDRVGDFNLNRSKSKDDNIHNLYEEIPCLGVTSEAVRNAVSGANPGAYASAVVYQNLQPNQNLLGFQVVLFQLGVNIRWKPM